MACLARDLLLGLGPVRDIAGDDEHGFDGVVVVAHGDRLDGEGQPFAEEVEATPLAQQCRTVRRERQLQHLVGNHPVQLGNQAAPEQVLVKPRQAPEPLTVGNQDPQVVVEEEHRRAREVRRQDSVQLVRALNRIGLPAKAALELRDLRCQCVGKRAEPDQL